jgi:hypothetical protein
MLGRQVPQVALGLLDHKEVRVLLVLKERLVQLVHKVFKVYRVCRVLLGILDLKAQLDLQEVKVLLDHKETLDLQVLKELLVRRVNQDNSVVQYSHTIT